MDDEGKLAIEQGQGGMLFRLDTQKRLKRIGRDDGEDWIGPKHQQPI